MSDHLAQRNPTQIQEYDKKCFLTDRQNIHITYKNTCITENNTSDVFTSLFTLLFTDCTCLHMFDLEKPNE